jgi:pimeloyl-ACP methyl ester carboxylesterase
MARIPRETSMGTFVFVHGSWHGGWCWKKLTPELATRGHVCGTPTLAGLGEHYHTASPSIDLSTHILDITNFLEFEDLRDVILVGHSYGGMVITGVADQSDRVGKLVYLDAIVPEHGESAFSLIDGLEEEFGRTADVNGMVPPWPPEKYGVTDPADIAWVKPRLTPLPIPTHREKLNAPKMKARLLPRYFVHCMQFRLGGQFAEKIRRQGATVFELNTGHDAMITEPVKLASILDRIDSS